MYRSAPGFVMHRLPVRFRHAVLACAAAAGLACRAPLAPYPQPLPPNIEIVSSPAAGDTLEIAAVDSVVITFDRRMDPESVWLVRRISFLLPLTVHELGGRWNAARTRLVFRLDRFPIQPGATYEALLVGLRTASGELYNGGPYPILFYTRGLPDLFPIPGSARLRSRDFCRRPAGSSGECSELLSLTSDPLGTDSLVLAATEVESGEFRRADLFRKTAAGIEWIGFDVPSGEARQAVRWPAPPLFVPDLPEVGAAWTAPAQQAADGTRLVAWRGTDLGTDTPVVRLADTGLPIQVTFPSSHILRFDYTLEFPSGGREERRERWWLHPGVGVVRREMHVERSDGTSPTDSVDVYEPGLGLLIP